MFRRCKGHPAERRASTISSKASARHATAPRVNSDKFGHNSGFPLLDKAAKRVANLVYLSGELHVVEARPVEMYTRPEGLGWLQNGERGRVVIG